MKYTLKLMYANGNTHMVLCATLSDVSHWMHHYMITQFGPKHNQSRITFQVIDNDRES